jgi:hypothetical protein
MNHYESEALKAYNQNDKETAQKHFDDAAGEAHALAMLARKHYDLKNWQHYLTKTKEYLEKGVGNMQDNYTEYPEFNKYRSLVYDEKEYLKLLQNRIKDEHNDYEARVRSEDTTKLIEHYHMHDYYPLQGKHDNQGFFQRGLIYNTEKPYAGAPRPPDGQPPTRPPQPTPIVPPTMAGFATYNAGAAADRAQLYPNTYMETAPDTRVLGSRATLATVAVNVGPPTQQPRARYLPQQVAAVSQLALDRPWVPLRNHRPLYPHG